MAQQSALVYLDYAATTPVDRRVVDTMHPFFVEQFANPNSLDHRLGWDARDAIERARVQVAMLINASPNEIVFTSSATEAINLAIKGIVLSNRSKHHRLVTTTVEHSAVLQTCRQLEEWRLSTTEYLPVDSDGCLDLDQVEESMAANSSTMLSVMHANNETGTLYPINELASIAHRSGSLLMTDATQSVGKANVDVRASRVDLLAFSAHKIYGPKGIGALFIRGGLSRQELSPLIVGGGQEHGLRSGTENVAAIVGFGKACEITMAEQMEHAEALGDYQRDFELKLKALHPDVVVLSDQTKRLPSISNVSFPGVESKELIQELRGYAFSRQAACATSAAKPSHVLQALGRTEPQCRQAIRISFGKSFTNQANASLPSAQKLASDIAAAVSLLRH
ncbi:cysteine desulfurase family protein [Roseiconus lacunae]|uniref:cysteine desulfurase family protein n=1 Tax=Roseiconus lacunae TaxID=2605694 RepID=UPI00308DC685|nr:cysteine desulfurase family protein [Stieleria sp. HD01]